MKQIIQPMKICNHKRGDYSDRRICEIVTLNEIRYNPATSTFLLLVDFALKSSHVQLIYMGTAIIALILRGKCFIEVQNTEVNNVYNVIIIQKANTKSSVGQHGPLTNAKVGSGA
jgi:hypothetical protein